MENDLEPWSWLGLPSIMSAALLCLGQAHSQWCDCMKLESSAQIGGSSSATVWPGPFPFGWHKGLFVWSQSWGSGEVGGWAALIQYSLRPVSVKRKVTKIPSWLLSHRASRRIVFLLRGFSLGRWPTHTDRVVLKWSAGAFRLPSVFTGLLCWCLPLPRGAVLWPVTGAVTPLTAFVFALQLTSGGRPHYYVSYRRNAFAQMKLPKYALPKVWPESPSLFLFFVPRTLSVSCSYYYFLIPHLHFSNSLAFFFAHLTIFLSVSIVPHFSFPLILWNSYYSLLSRVSW